MWLLCSSHKPAAMAERMQLLYLPGLTTLVTQVRGNLPVLGPFVRTQGFFNSLK